MRLASGARVLLEGPGPFVMGVVNVTPDSFFPGGRHPGTDEAIAHGLGLVREGADLLDIGGESTRPGAPQVSEVDQIARVVPVVRGLRAHGVTLPLSVDTTRAAVAEAALLAGADIVNDVSGLAADPALGPTLARLGAPAVLMHMRGTPADMEKRAVYSDVVREVVAELLQSVSVAQRFGISRDRLIVDPGLGFAKTAEQNVELLARLPELRAMGLPLLVGPSRKSFIGKITGASVEDRLPGTLAVVAVCVLAGVEIVRVHDVAASKQAASMAAALRNAAHTG